ncbi:sugar ABC transporter substrate-binding protein [Effusibacillus lacus]|uniref:Rhizopine-binding protein n=1 Tax=Effusibacillus lacus TaxID=1348429 RepID=A0A292YD00_9BACL|nr:sugar ABC transporter substrate-binding protein [Effusibacillus lacus]TCS68396.1 monosaccharide ABC transporter substrate-binding protein (CUT2 family) [Effusibacillus lacus]GAX89652.1 rhizopine-binding protein [Effusibacillus lacus]
MKAKRSLVLFLCLMCFAVILSACSGGSTPSGNTGTGSGDKGKKIVIGAALPDFSDKWLSYLQDGMKQYQKTLQDVDVTYVDAQNDANKQLAQVETFISQKVNAIVIVPVDTVSAVDIVARANKANIPIVVVNRMFDGVDKATSYVGSESIKSGIIEMEEVAKLLKGKGNIAIMNGQMGHEAQIKRTEGNKQVISKYPDMKVVLEGTGSWDRAKGMALMENWLNSGQKIDAVVSNNDEMAIGAIMAAEAAGKQKDILFAGIDATPDALEFVKSGKLQVTVFQNAAGQGKGGLETAVKAARGERVEKFVYIPFELVTKDNVEEYVKKWSK